MFVLHNDVAGFLPFAHIVEHDIVFGDIKVKVNFHTPLVCVYRHGVPYRTGVQRGAAHRKLAGFQYGGVNKLIDNALI